MHLKMSTCRSFTRFQALPPELRQMIWIEALTSTSVWVVAGRDATDCAAIDKRRPDTMTCCGPPPYLVGLSCTEARQILERIYKRPIHGPGSSSTSAAVFWVNLDRTVIFLSSAVGASSTLRSFGAYELSRLTHVALPWYQFSMLAMVFQYLAANCPALRTVIIQLVVDKDGVIDMTPRPLNPQAANYYAKLLDYQGHELGCDEMDTPYFRGLLYAYFGDTPPRIHVLPSRPSIDRGP